MSNANHSSAFITNEPINSSEYKESVNPLLVKYTGQARINNNTTYVTYLRDTGATISLLTATEQTANQLEYTGEHVTIRGVNYIPGNYPLAKINVNCPIYQGTLTVAILTHRCAAGVDLIIGNDCDIDPVADLITCGVVTRSNKTAISFDETVVSIPNLENTPDTEEYVLPFRNTIEINSPSEKASKETPHDSPSIDDLSPDKLLQEQKNDPTLLPLWEMAHEEKPMRQGYYIQPESRLLMRREQPQDPSKVRPWKIYDQVVVPRGFRNHITGIAHDSLSMGHLGPSKTLKRIKRRFFRPGIRADVKRFCHSCGPCQRAGKGQKSTIAPLKPLPIISQPFKFISADFVGPMAYDSPDPTLLDYQAPTDLEKEFDPCSPLESVPKKAWPDLSHLPPGHRDEITQILDRYPRLFSGKLGCFQGVTHDIDVQGAAPVIQPYYRMSPEKKQILKTELDKMLELGIIRPSRSQWASPIILVRKSYSEWRPG
ncbi:hypothetical protein [Solemya elarraichensis gill symbiont]|nr:hypothetical protein [Solemya elarraichensis gill symbiont]